MRLLTVSRLSRLAIALLVISYGEHAWAQAARDARLIVTVVDQTGAVIPGATVTLTGLEEPTRSAAGAPVATSDKGVAAWDRLAIGRYAIQADFPGFDSGRLTDVRLRRGDNKHVITLAIKRMEESVSVAQDPQAAAADPRGSAFTTKLTQDEIDALSDDPDEMTQQLLDLAGPNAVIKVDSFLGATLPPKAQIKSIHIVRDAFAAENHAAESEGIEIITQPGTGPIRGGFSSRFRDGSMSGRSPFTPTKGPERTERYDGNFGGTIVRNRSSFFLSGGSNRSFDTPTLNVALPGGQTRSEVLGLRRPNDNWFLHGLVDYAVTKNQMLRVAYDQSSSERKNLGVGAYDLAERAYSSESQNRELRILEVGPIGRRMFANTRLQLEWSRNRSQAALEAQTLRVQDAFTSGGAQTRGGRRMRDFEAATDIDYIRGLHTVRFGAVFEGGQYRTDDSQNYLGTYVFTSLAAYEARQPTIYTRRIGNPLIEYFFLRSGVYVQDDLRVRKNLTFSPGVRYEAQTHLSDYSSVGPRFGMTWSPFKSGKTTLRGSWGIFYNWLQQNVYEQSLRVDGFRQQEINIANPSFPDPGTIGTVNATNKYLLDGDLDMARTQRVSAGIDRTLSSKLRASLAFSSVRGSRVVHGINRNAPANGVRPDAAFANVIAVASEGESRFDQLTTTLNLNLAPARRPAVPPLWDWRRVNARLTYWLAKQTNNTDGAFSVSPTGTRATEWGPSREDRRHRMAASVNTQLLRDLNATLSLNGNAGAPYNLTTGFDDNGDSIFNDRPPGVGRNTLRTPSQWTWNANASYSLRMGVRAETSSQERGADGAKRVATQANSRYRLTFNVSVNNLTNHANYTGFSGVMTSPFFLQPTAVSNPRKVDMSVSFGF